MGEPLHESKVSLNKMVDDWRPHPRSGKRPRIAWGCRSRSEEDEEASIEAAYRQSSALIDYLDNQYEVLIAPAGDPELSDMCTLSADLADWCGMDSEQPSDDTLDLLPLSDERKLFNIIDGVWPASLSLVPTSDGLAIVGLKVRLTLDGNSKTLRTALNNLSGGMGVLVGWLYRNEGDDHYDQFPLV